MKTNWQVAINRMEFHRRFSPKGSLFTLLEEKEEESRYRKRIKFHGRLGWWNVKTARPRFASSLHLLPLDRKGAE